MDGFPPLATWIAGGAFVVNILVIVWTASRSQARTEASIAQAIAGEREKRMEQIYDAREFARGQAAAAAAKADAAVSKITDVEMRLMQTLQQYPSKTDIREMLNEKLEPVAARLDTVYDELMRRGVQSTAVRPNGER